MKTQLCENCKTELQGAVCHKCGQPVLPRWTIPILIRQFISFFTDVEKGFVYTIKGLFVFPGKLITNYWKGSTIKYYHPFRYVLIWTAISLLINFWLGFDDLLQASMQPEIVDQKFSPDQIQSADQKFDSWLNLLVLLMIPVNGFITLQLFKKSGNNYAEHLIMNAFILGQQSLISSFTQFVFYYFPVLFVAFLPFNFLVGWGYNSYVFRNVFLEPWSRIVLKALLMGIIGLIVYFGLIILFSSAALLT